MTTSRSPQILIMESRGITWLQRCLLVVLSLSTAIMFISTYYIYSIDLLGALFDLSYESVSPFALLSRELHPEKHIHRSPTTLTHHWNITKGHGSPDGVHKVVYLINGEFPGPPIEARSGDTLVVTVSNQLEDNEGVSVHWHGLHMRGANNMDGVVGVTQRAIPARHDFAYEFKISSHQAGTFWYHSHSKLQRSDGLYGGLVVHNQLENAGSESAKFGYGKKQLLLIGDWYHRSAKDIQANYLTFRSSGHECESVETPIVYLGSESTRLRVFNVGAMAGINITIPNGRMQVIRIDGGNENFPSPWVESVGILFPRERMDIVVSVDGVTSLSITLDPENFTFMNQALQPTHEFPIAHTKNGVRTRSHPRCLDSPKARFDLSTALSLPLSAMPVSANQTILIYTHIEMLVHFDHVPMGYMNRTNWIPQEVPLIDLPRDQWDEHQFMPEIEASSEWVDIIISNIDDKGHPFHLHGYEFCVLIRHAFPRRAGYRTYNPFDPPAPPSSPSATVLYPKPNLENPPTIHIPRRGYVILRIRADNVGIWLFHCHILWHQGNGMAMGFAVREKT